jgi:Kef-type K+ transport system membrane component KefB
MVAVCAAGYITSNLSMPDLVGHIIVGVLLGPPLANYVPFPAAFVMFGYIGIILLMVDAGINMDIAQLRLTGWRSVVLAHVGAFLSLAMGMLVATFSKSVTIQGAVCLGAVFAPTSFGVSSNALISEKIINTPTGQIIVAAAIIDDLIALVILSVVQQWVAGGSNTGIIQFFIPIISSVLFLVIGGYVAIYHIPKLLTKYVISKFPERRRKRVAFVLLALLTMAYMPLMDICKTNFLTGAYLSGLSFNQIPCVDQSFKNNTKNIFSWLLRVFFSASIGFQVCVPLPQKVVCTIFCGWILTVVIIVELQVPLKLYGDPLVIGWGFAFYFAVLGKIPTGFFVPKSKAPKAYPFKRYWRDFLIVGVAMTCRGELSFFIATYAMASGLVSEEMYASAVWAAFLSCITSPIALRALIRYYNRLAKKYIESPNVVLEGDENKMPMYWVIHVQTAVISGFYDHLISAIDDLGLAVIDARSWSPASLEDIVLTKIYTEDSENLISVPLDSSHDQLLKRAFLKLENKSSVDNGILDRNQKTQARVEDAIPEGETHETLPLDELEDISALNKCFGDDARTMEHRRQEIRTGKEGQNMYCKLECMQKSVFLTG